MASVLIVEPVLELRDLLRDLAALASHEPVLVASLGRAPAAPNVAGGELIVADASMPQAVCDRCVCLAADLGAIVVYYASTLSDYELRLFASRRNAPYFCLPGDPRLLGGVLRDALDRRLLFASRKAAAPTTTGPHGRVSAVVQRVALAQARSRLIIEAADVLRADSRQLREERRALLDETKGRMDALRSAVMGSATAMRAAGAPPESSLALVRETLSRSGLLASPATPGMRGEADRWVLEAYRVA